MPTHEPNLFIKFSTMFKKKEGEKMKNKLFYIHETENGYIYDKRIFWSILILGVLIIGGLYYVDGTSYKFYFECDDPRGCLNPLYDAQYYNPTTKYDYKSDCVEYWCTMERLPMGHYGEPSRPIYKYFSLIMISLVILGLSLNHITYNRGREFGIKLNLPDKMLKYIKDKYENLEDNKGGKK